MNSVVIWIRDGAFAERPKKKNDSDYQDKSLFDQFAMVRISTDTNGTLVQWNMASPNWSSLMLAAKLLSACAGPFSLKYFKSGWFVEKLQDASSAADRLDALIYKSDVHLKERAYTAVLVPDMQVIPSRLRNALLTGTAPNDDSVVCAIEADGEICNVEHVGKDTAIGRIWGVSPNSYPCLNGHSYDRVVTPEYFRVVQSGRVHYDHVLASMVRPDGELHWLGYHRVILPEVRQGQTFVRVVSEVAPVKI